MHTSALGEGFSKTREKPQLTQMAAVRTLVAIPTQFGVPRGRWLDSWAAGEESAVRKRSPRFSHSRTRGTFLAHSGSVEDPDTDPCPSQARASFPHADTGTPHSTPHPHTGGQEGVGPDQHVPARASTPFRASAPPSPECAAG